MLPRQNQDGNLTFVLLALNLYISLPFTNKQHCHYYNANSNKIVFALVKLISIFFSGAPNLSLITKNLDLHLKLKIHFLSTPNTITFLARSLPKLHLPFPSNAIP